VKKIISYSVTLAALCLCSSGCALLQLPFKILGTIMEVAGQAFKLADKLPTPPPGVF